MSDTSAQPVWTPTCALCNSLVQLETCKTDEHGSAAHEECYVRKIRRAYGLRFLAHVAHVAGYLTIANRDGSRV
jgi:hypothetical protein